jgi:hypothetical protein
MWSSNLFHSKLLEKVYFHWSKKIVKVGSTTSSLMLPQCVQNTFCTYFFSRLFPQRQHILRRWHSYTIWSNSATLLRRRLYRRGLCRSQKQKKRSRNTLESFYYESDKESDKGSSAPINTSLNARVNQDIDTALRLTWNRRIISRIWTRYIYFMWCKIVQRPCLLLLLCIETSPV